MTGPDVVTLGCRLNTYESQVIRREADAAGLHDAVIVNTCAVTSEAVRQARQAIRRARRERPQSRIIVTGCAAQISPDTFAKMPEVDLVLGNEEKLDRASYTLPAFGLQDEERVRVNDIMSVRETAAHMIDGFAERTRAFVQIQNGCDHRCTFCIIPFGRGNSRSVPAGEVVQQVRKLVKTGYREIVLTGVDITAYGADLPGGIRLGALVLKVLQLVPDLDRLRLSSIDSVETDADLLRAFANEERLMPHVHLSLQSGDDMILKRMKRRHSRSQSVEFCQQLRELRPDVVYGADLIAGFPTETGEMFENSARLVDDCGLTWLHVFPFSAREGTPAARMPQLDGRIVRERARTLRKAGAHRLASFLRNETGRHRSALAETSHRGRSEHYAPVLFDRPVEPGAVIPVEITGVAQDALEGQVV